MEDAGFRKESREEFRKEFTKEVLRKAGEEIRTCIQCGTCSASCPTAHLMDASPRKLVRLVLEGKKEEALGANTLWLCTSCELCTVRCPRGIRPKALVAALRDICEREGRKGPEQAYDELFLKQIKERGRISETQLSGEYFLRNPASAVQAMKMGLEMAPKGKISLEKEKVQRPEEVRKIIEELEKA